MKFSIFFIIFAQQREDGQSPAIRIATIQHHYLYIHTFMPYQQIQRNRPVATLIKWYIDKKSGKVSEAVKKYKDGLTIWTGKTRNVSSSPFLMRARMIGLGHTQRFIVNGMTVI
jgi:hypothetical protein